MELHSQVPNFSNDAQAVKRLSETLSPVIEKWAKMIEPVVQAIKNVQIPQMKISSDVVMPSIGSIHHDLPEVVSPDLFDLDDETYSNEHKRPIGFEYPHQTKRCSN